MPRIDAAVLERFARELLEATGVPSTNAEQVAASLVAADLRGHDTHGVFRIPWYVDGFENRDWIDPAATPTVVSESPVTAVVDGNATFGQVAGRVAVDVACEKAADAGVGVVGVRDATHLGRIGEWAECVTAEGYLATLQVGTQGGSETVAPAGSGEGLYSTNPMAYGVPTFDALGFPIVLDMATSQVAHGKIRRYAAEGEPLPDEWTTDEHGDPIRDASAFVDGPGAVLPLGGRAAGYKGFGLAVMAELFSAIVGDGLVSGQQDLDRSQNVAAVYVVDPTQFTTEAAIEERIRVFTDRIRSASYSADVPLGHGATDERGLLPGEPEYQHLSEREQEGIPLAEATADDLRALAREYGVADALPF